MYIATYMDNNKYAAIYTYVSILADYYYTQDM